MNRKILITGGAGFIGSRVVKRLHDNGEIPIVIKRRTTSTWRIDDIIDRIITYNVEDTKLEDIFGIEQVTAVIHLAAYYKKEHTYDDIDKMIDTNVRFPTKLLELCKIHHVPLFITAGSFFQYDSHDEVLGNGTHTDARDLYAATKNALESLINYYSSNTDVKAFSLVIFTPYGEMDHDDRLVPYIIGQALSGKPAILTSGFQKLNLVYVEDIADAFVKALEVGNADVPHRINIANMESNSIREIVTVIEDLIGYHIDVKWGSRKMADTDASKMTTVDTAASEEILGWTPKFDIYDGMKRTIDYYREKYNES